VTTHDPAALAPTARRLLAAAQDILAERGYAELTITAISQVSGVNRALVSYYFGGKAGLLAALVETLFLDPDVGYVEEIRATRGGEDRADAFLDWQRRVSQNDRTNRMLYELLPHALREPEVRARFAEEYRVYRAVDGDCLSGTPRELDAEELEALGAVSIAVVEGLGIQRALDPEGFDHERAWRMWRDVIGAYLLLPPA
jgi:AcrR family transcriptional regulator